MRWSRHENLVRFVELPVQVIDVEQQDFSRVLTGKLIEYPLLPALGEVFFRFQVFVKKTLLVRNTQKVQDIDNHVEMREQEYLRKVRGEILLAGFDASPETRLSLAQ